QRGFGSAEDPALRDRSPGQCLCGRRIRIRHWRRQTEGTPHYPAGHLETLASPGVQTTRGGRGTRRYCKVMLFPVCRQGAGLREPPHENTMGTITAQVQLTEAELKLLQTLVYQECGMFFDERRSHFLK